MASIAACVGTCLYGAGLSTFSACWACLWSFAAFFAPLILENIDMVTVATGVEDRNDEKVCNG